MQNKPILGTKLTNDGNDKFFPENEYCCSNGCLMTNIIQRPKSDFFYFIIRNYFGHFSGIIGHFRQFVPKLIDFWSFFTSYPSVKRHFSMIIVSGDIQ